MFHRQAIILGLSFAFTLIPVSSAKAQLIPDNTLVKENSLVNSINSLEDLIDGGAIRGSNLFHSFKEFNVDNGRSVYFNNPSQIKNILTRVTGNNQSNILGKLGVKGDVNLFLINPNGIIFGKDASLDINGSFVGSTASFIDFADGTEFSAVSPDKPLLTISAPLGLGMGINPGEIRVQGNAHRISRSGLVFPFIDNNTKALEVNPGKTIALIGGNIILSGGSLRTNSGRIELGSVGSGIVDFNITPESFEFRYDRVESFQDIKLSNKSSLQLISFPINPQISNNLIDAGSIRLQGKQIFVTNGSMILVSNQGNLASKGININSTESLEISNSNIKEGEPSSLRSQALFTGQGNDIKISTKHLFMKDGGGISAYNFGSQSGENIEINASDSVEMTGFSNQLKTPNLIITNQFNSGNGGNIDISTAKLKIFDGGIISSSSFNQGDAGNLTINARESIELVGFNRNSSELNLSIISSLTLGSGNGGSLTLNTQKLTVKDGGRVDASTVGKGAAGSITINASDKVEITGFVNNLGYFIPSSITSSADITDKPLQKLFGLPESFTGESGSIIINTNQFNIADNALLAVKNDGLGNAGKLQVKADSININNQGSISATTASGRGGNIDLQAQNLLLRGNSNISATSGGTGNGGNITIDSQVITALENSDITANSEGSFGGRVEINAKGIFGSQFREFLTPESDITATSGLGAEFNGVVDINTIIINRDFALAELPTGLTDSSQKIVAGCSANRDSKFTAIGRGGLPESPNQLFTGNTPTVDLFDLVSTSENQEYSASSEVSINNPINQDQREIVEAKGWIADPQGNIEFVAEVPEVENSYEELQTADCQYIK